MAVVVLGVALGLAGCAEGGAPSTTLTAMVPTSEAVVLDGLSEEQIAGMIEIIASGPLLGGAEIPGQLYVGFHGEFAGCDGEITGDPMVLHLVYSSAPWAEIVADLVARHEGTPWVFDVWAEGQGASFVLHLEDDVHLTVDARYSDPAELLVRGNIRVGSEKVLCDSTGQDRDDDEGQSA